MAGAYYTRAAFLNASRIVASDRTGIQWQPGQFSTGQDAVGAEDGAEAVASFPDAAVNALRTQQSADARFASNGGAMRFGLESLQAAAIERMRLDAGLTGRCADATTNGSALFHLSYVARNRRVQAATRASVSSRPEPPYVTSDRASAMRCRATADAGLRKLIFGRTAAVRTFPFSLRNLDGRRTAVTNRNLKAAAHCRRSFRQHRRQRSLAAPMRRH